MYGDGGVRPILSSVMISVMICLLPRREALGMDASGGLLQRVLRMVGNYWLPRCGRPEGPGVRPNAWSPDGTCVSSEPGLGRRRSCEPRGGLGVVPTSCVTRRAGADHRWKEACPVHVSGDVVMGHLSRAKLFVPGTTWSWALKNPFPRASRCSASVVRFCVFPIHSAVPHLPRPC